MSESRVLVMGCGGIGGLITASLLEHGVDVVAVTHNPEIADAINARGFEVRDEDRSRRVSGRASVSIPPEPGTFDFVFLVTQPPQVGRRGARRPALPSPRRRRGVLPERPVRVAHRRRGRHRPYDRRHRGMGRSMPGPGVYDRTSAGGFGSAGSMAAPILASASWPLAPPRSAPSTSPTTCGARAGASSPSTAPSARSAPSAAIGSERWFAIDSSAVWPSKS